METGDSVARGGAWRACLGAALALLPACRDYLDHDRCADTAAAWGAATVQPGGAAQPEAPGPLPVGWLDEDGDGFGAPPTDPIGPASPDDLPALSTAWIDCDDGDPARHPGATELCNLVDDDCDGLIDAMDPGLPVGAVPMDLELPAFLVAGQSNAVGSGADYAALGAVDQWSPVALELWVSGAPARLEGQADRMFGPELGFSQEVVGTGPAWTTLVKRAQGGTDLAGDWAPGGPLLEALLDDVAVASTCHAVRVDALLWMQGGADALWASRAAAYEANLDATVAALRSELGDVAVLVGQSTGDPEVYTYIDAVAAAQEAWAAGDPWACLVDTSDLPMPDGSHYDAAGQLELGRRFADAWWSLSEEGRCPTSP